jgi:hypothetical protein
MTAMRTMEYQHDTCRNDHQHQQDASAAASGSTTASLSHHSTYRILYLFTHIAMNILAVITSLLVCLIINIRGQTFLSSGIDVGDYVSSLLENSEVR